jgi:hypothetical protein
MFGDEVNSVIVKDTHASLSRSHAVHAMPCHVGCLLASACPGSLVAKQTEMSEWRRDFEFATDRCMNPFS